MIVEYGERLIEVQLRTRSQHAWAMFVERLMSLSGQDFKSGLGTAVVLSFLRLAAEGMAMEDRSVQPSETFMATFENARRDAFVASDSFDTVKVTHANYFDEDLVVSRFLTLDRPEPLPT